MTQKQYAYFSAAIRDGAKLRPQAFGSLRTIDGRSCSLGAGMEALGIDVPLDESQQVGLYPKLGNFFPYLSKRVQCSACEGGDYNSSLFNVIWHLNDHHEWTREAIADWLYEEEEKLGFITIDTEALKPEVANDLAPLNVTV